MSGRASIVPRVDRRKTREEEVVIGKHSYDAQTGKRIIKIFSGEWHVSTEPDEIIDTILGSCVAACIRDPLVGVGGMNHFLLPGDENMATQNSDAARYGVFAMENLINGIMKAGGHKDHLEIKVFGGGNVIKSSARIGSKNAAFIRAFVLREGLHITSEDLEGDLPRRVQYSPDTGKVLMRRLQRKDDFRVVDEEALYRSKISTAPVEGTIDLF